MGIIYFSVTHINYKIESRLIPMHCDLFIFPQEGGSGKPIGNKTLFENSIGFPTHKQIFGVQNSLVGHHIYYEISFRTSRKSIKCPNRVYRCSILFPWVVIFGCLITMVYPLSWWRILIGALVLAILKRAEIC